MAETHAASDLQLGVSLLLGFVVVLASITMAWAAYLSSTQGSDTMQLLSGIGLTVALLAGTVAVVAIHVFE